MARTFALEGAKVFFLGRTRETLDSVAKDIASVGGSAEVAVVDALDERGVDDHVRDVVSKAGAASTCPSTSSAAGTCRAFRRSR